MPKALAELPFIDLYVRLDQSGQMFYRSKERDKFSLNLPVPADFADSVSRLAEAVRQKLEGHIEASITFEDMRFRLSRLVFQDGSVWFCARRISTNVPDIESLNLPPLFKNHMLGLGKRDGLIIVSGATGQGKTTTAVSLLSYWLKTYGGTAITIEDPCEYIVAGRHGDGGQCYQIEIENDGEWAEYLKRAMRWSPRYIYIGEIRTPKAAEQVLGAASTGHLVITTMHASTMEESLNNLIFLAEQTMGAGVYNMLATAFTALINQSLKDALNPAIKEAQPHLKYLFSEENSVGDPVRSLIRENKIGMLSTYIDRAEARLKTAVMPQPLGAKKP